MNSKKRISGLVYSSTYGRICPKCGMAAKDCLCGKAKSATPEGDGVVRLSRETKGRKGKSVTIISGVLLEDAELKGLAKELKQKCGSGGTVKKGVIEIQGDHRKILMDELRERGYTVKRAGW